MLLNPVFLFAKLLKRSKSLLTPQPSISPCIYLFTLLDEIRDPLLAILSWGTINPSSRLDKAPSEAFSIISSLAIREPSTPSTSATEDTWLDNSTLEGRRGLTYGWKSDNTLLIVFSPYVWSPWTSSHFSLINPDWRNNLSILFESPFVQYAKCDINAKSASLWLPYELISPLNNASIP